MLLSSCLHRRVGAAPASWLVPVFTHPPRPFAPHSLQQACAGGDMGECPWLALDVAMEPTRPSQPSLSLRSYPAKQESPTGFRP